MSPNWQPILSLVTRITSHSFVNPSIVTIEIEEADGQSSICHRTLRSFAEKRMWSEKLLELDLK